MKSEKVGGVVPMGGVGVGGGGSTAANEIVVYQTNETMRLEVMVNADTVWLNRQQIAQLFGRDVKTIGKHIANAFREELSPTVANFATVGIDKRKGTVQGAQTVRASSENRVVAKFATTALDGKTYQVEYYNLEMITSVGYRVKSPEGVMFRRWANQVLKEYLLRGVAVNARLAQLEDKVDRRLAKHEQDIVALRERVDFVVQSALPAPEMVFMEGEFLTAHDAIRKIVKAAKKRLVLIDNYIDERVLTLLSERRKGVACHVYGKNAEKRDVQLAFARYQQQFPNDGLTLTQWSNAHDRFIICDDTVWLCGASVKDAGRRMFALVKMSTKPDFILSELPLLSESDKQSSVRHILQ